MILLVMSLTAAGEGVLRVLQDEPRTWTQLGTDKTFEARLVAKDADGKFVTLRNGSGKDFRVEVANLKAADLDFINAWKPLPEGFVWLKVEPTKEEGRRPGERLFKVFVAADEEDVEFHAAAADGKGIPHSGTIMAGKTHNSQPSLPAKSPVVITVKTKDGRLLAEWKSLSDGR